jgi:hypothetical protein
MGYVRFATRGPSQCSELAVFSVGLNCSQRTVSRVSLNVDKTWLMQFITETSSLKDLNKFK